MIERVSTGVKGLDDRIGGGVPKSLVTAITGPIGIGKTCLAWQFLNAGLYVDESVLLLTSKDSPELHLQTAANLGYDLNWALDQHRLFILDWRYILVSGAMAPDLVQTFLNRVQTLIDEYGIKRIVFDSLLPSGFIDPAMSQSFYKAIQHQLSEQFQGISIWVLMPEPFSIMLQGALPFDTWIQLAGTDTEPRQRSLRIQKMPCTAIHQDAFTFDIIKGEGIVI